MVLSFVLGNEKITNGMTVHIIEDRMDLDVKKKVQKEMNCIRLDNHLDCIHDESSDMVNGLLQKSRGRHDLIIICRRHRHWCHGYISRKKV